MSPIQDARLEVWSRQTLEKYLEYFKWMKQKKNVGIVFR